MLSTKHKSCPSVRVYKNGKRAPSHEWSSPQAHANYTSASLLVTWVEKCRMAEGPQVQLGRPAFSFHSRQNDGFTQCLFLLFVKQRWELLLCPGCENAGSQRWKSCPQKVKKRKGGQVKNNLAGISAWDREDGRKWYGENGWENAL